jgi:hypothetical protein
MLDDSIKKICPICKLEDDSIEKISDNTMKYLVKCPRCKNYTITFQASQAMGGQYPIPKLSAWIRDFNEKQTGIPEIYQESLEKIPASLPDRSPREKQITLLQNIERKTEYPGKPILIIPENDIPLAWAKTKEEFLYYIESLIERGLLRITDKDRQVNDLIFSVAITADGWDYLEKLDRHIEERTQAFVAMSFKEDLKHIWEGPIKNAIEKAGYKPYRVDAAPHIGLIDVKIISEIKNSRFVVADFTYQNRGVYFETGYAQGMGLPVIRCVKEDNFEKLHFDKNHYNFIIWKTPSDLEDQLYNYICAIIGKGKEA